MKFLCRVVSSRRVASEREKLKAERFLSSSEATERITARRYELLHQCLLIRSAPKLTPLIQDAALQACCTCPPSHSSGKCVQSLIFVIGWKTAFGDIAVGHCGPRDHHQEGVRGYLWNQLRRQNSCREAGEDELPLPEARGSRGGLGSNGGRDGGQYRKSSFLVYLLACQLALFASTAFWNLTMLLIGILVLFLFHLRILVCNTTTTQSRFSLN